MPSAREVLGPKGPLSRGLHGYEDRPGQLAMAEAVERALAHDRVLVCEAGTGTGKTLAYLVPAILSGKKVIVSTATRALQEQIVEKDIPLIRQVLGLRVNAALMKGLSNYLCRRRFDEFRASPEANDPRASRVLATLEEWAKSTDSGDVGSIANMSEEEAVWREVSSSSDTRVGQGCEHFDSCFVTRMKRAAEAARIVVVNHHLFFADLALRGPHAGGALPPYDAVIFDEAHQLEDVATDFFGVRVSSARVNTTLRDTERGFVAAGFSDRLLRKGEGAAIVEIAREAAGRFFDAVAAAQAVSLAKEAVGLSSSRVHAGPARDARTTIGADFWRGDLVAQYHKLDAALEALAAYAEARQTSEAIELIVRRVSQLREDTAQVVDGARNHVAWAEVKARSVAIGTSPVELATTMKSRLFDQVPAVVLTSATLSTHHGFSFLRSRLGLTSADVPVEELDVPSPFDYPTKALVYLPRDLPDPSEPRWMDAAVTRAQELISATGGGAFVLATSKRVMEGLHAGLRRGTARRLYVQGSGPKSVLLDRFRQDGDAVLVATMSFWEGVDVPGHALRLVIIDKIPFPVPSDPVLLARGAAIEAAGQNPFVAYHVPTAAITLKQGFGRLIRTREDAGIVAILDKRVHTRSYGRLLLDSLPPARRTEKLEDALRFARELPRGVAS